MLNSVLLWLSIHPQPHVTCGRTPAQAKTPTPTRRPLETTQHVQHNPQPSATWDPCLGPLAITLKTKTKNKQTKTLLGQLASLYFFVILKFHNKKIYSRHLINGNFLNCSTSFNERAINTPLCLTSLRPILGFLEPRDLTHTKGNYF